VSDFPRGPAKPEIIGLFRFSPASRPIADELFFFPRSLILPSFSNLMSPQLETVFMAAVFAIVSEGPLLISNRSACPSRDSRPPVPGGMLWDMFKRT